MIQSIKDLFQDLKKDKNIRLLIKRLLFFSIIFIILFTANHYFFNHYADRVMFHDSIERTRIVFSANGSVYSADIKPAHEVTGVQNNQQNKSSNHKFQLPIYALIYYAPFSLIKDFDISLALWITTNQLICFLIVEKMIKIMGAQLKKPFDVILPLSSLIIYFLINNVFQTNLAVIQLFLLTLSIQKIQERKNIFTGILLGLAAFNIRYFIFPFSIMMLSNFNKKRTTVVVWCMITLIILSLAFLISDMRWPLEMIKTVLFNPSIYPLISFRSYLDNHLLTQSSSLVESIPIIVLLWIIVEWLRSPRENQMQELWLVSLGMTLNPLLTMWDSPYSTSAYVFVVMYCVSQWFERSSKRFKMLSLGLFFSVFGILPVYKMITAQQIISMPQKNAFNILLTLFLLLNLYWIRLWVMNPYTTINSSEI